MHTFKTVSDIRIAPGGAAKLDLFVEALSANKRIAIVTDRGVRSLGLIDAGVEALRSAGYDVMIFDQVVADPPDTIVLEIADGLREFGAGLVIGFGGGSPMDTAKVVRPALCRPRLVGCGTDTRSACLDHGKYGH